MASQKSYTATEIREIINKTWPHLTVAFYEADLHYMPMDMQQLHSVWVNSKLGNFNWTKEKFDCDDFAVCLKAEMAKYSYSQQAAGGRGGSLCGIMWGAKSNAAHAFNFTIDPLKNVILFEPQNGKEIGKDDWNPYFCML